MGGIYRTIADQKKLELKNKLEERLQNFICESKTRCCEIGGIEALEIIKKVIMEITAEKIEELKKEIKKYTPDPGGKPLYYDSLQDPRD